jgi:two-component system, chemotaxis family, chemotaxis protein CheY
MAKRYTTDDLNRILTRFEDLVLERATYFLLIDKQVSLRKGLANALIKAGVEQECILEASDGLDAIGFAKRNKNRFIVIFDIAIPDTDAPVVIKKIREKEGHENDLVILHTAETNKAKLAAAMKTGVSDYLKKPTQPDQIIEKLKSLEVI